MNRTACVSCQSTKALLNCDVCDTTACKYCAHLLNEDELSFWEARPEILHKTKFCSDCYYKLVESDYLKFKETYKKAKDVAIFFDDQGKETRLFKRQERAIKVDNCEGRDDVIMKIAFYATLQGFDTVVDVKISTRKVNNGSYQTSIWSGQGIPVKPRS